MTKEKRIPNEVIQTAMMIDLPRFLEQQGIKLKAYSSCWEYGKGAEKVTLWQDRRDGHYQWKRQYDGISGNAIQWLMAFGTVRSFADAVYLLYDWAGGRSPELGRISAAPAVPVEEKKKGGDFRLPPADRSFGRVMAYLCKTRRIDPGVVTAFHNAGLIYESAIHHNAVFVGRDKEGIPRHANLRSTVTNEKGRAFRINQEYSDPRYAFHWVGTGQRLYVFEAPIDLLSFITLHPNNWQQHNYTALCGVFPDAMVQLLEDHPHIQQVALCCDNDEWGRKGNQRCAEVLKKRCVPYGILISKGKDWNDDLRESL